MIDKRISFEEQYDCELYETTTLYFTIEKSLLDELTGNKYPEAESGELSVEFPTNHAEASFSSVEISPTIDGEDYEWQDILLPYEEIEELLNFQAKYEQFDENGCKTEAINERSYEDCLALLKECIRRNILQHAVTGDGMCVLVYMKPTDGSPTGWYWRTLTSAALDLFNDQKGQNAIVERLMNKMKKFYIPVEWSVWDKVEVEAETIEEAVQYVRDNLDEIPLGTDPEYIDGTYKISGDENQPLDVLIREELEPFWDMSDEER